MNLTRAVGVDIVSFINKGFPEGYYLDDSIYAVSEDGRIFEGDVDEEKVSMSLTASYNLSDFGELFPEGNSFGKAISFEEAFTKWYTERQAVTFTVTVSPEQSEFMRTLLTGMAPLGIKFSEAK